tara:strand:+ start:982 stop:1386 length:405 start_codon:yes stop_codon:yes gene_type:complete
MQILLSLKNSKLCLSSKRTDLNPEELQTKQSHNGFMRFVYKQIFIYLVVSASIASLTTTFGARYRIEQMNQICSSYIGGSDLFRDSDSKIGQPKFITCNQFVEEKYSIFPFQIFFLNMFVLLTLICVFNWYYKD